MNKQQEITLKAALEMAQGHLDRIHEILAEDLKNIIPFTEEKMKNITRVEKNTCDALIYQFMHVQDTLATRVFPLYLDALGEESEKIPFIDKLNRLEKLGIIEKAYGWQDLRKLRNHFSHDYAYEPERQAKFLNELCKAVPLLSQTLARIIAHVQKL